jgi:hypothetical protein
VDNHPPLNPNPTTLGITLLKTILISSNGELMMEGTMVPILDPDTGLELQALQVRVVQVVPMEPLVVTDLKAVNPT